LHKLFKLKDELGELSNKDENKFKKLKRQAEEKIMGAADVITSTCVASFDRRLKIFRFTRVLNYILLFISQYLLLEGFN